MLIINLICLIFLLIIPFSLSICEKLIINLTPNQVNLSVAISSLINSTASNISCSSDFQDIPTLYQNDNSYNVNIDEKVSINLLKHYKGFKIHSTILGDILDNNTILNNDSISTYEEFFNKPSNLIQVDKENKKVLARFLNPNLSLYDTFYYFTIEDDFLEGLGSNILGYSKNYKGIRVYNVRDNYMQKEKEILKEEYPEKIFTYLNNQTNNSFILIKSLTSLSIHELMSKNDSIEETQINFIIQNKTIIDDNIINYFTKDDYHYLCLQKLGILVYDNHGLLVNNLSLLSINENNKNNILIKKAILQGQYLYLLITSKGVVRCDLNITTDLNKCDSILKHSSIGGFEIIKNYIHIFFEENGYNDEFYLKAGLSGTNLSANKLLLLKHKGICMNTSIMLNDFIFLMDKVTQSLLVISTDSYSNDNDIIFKLPFYQTSKDTYKFKDLFKLYDEENNIVAGVRLENNAVVLISNVEINHKKLEIEFYTEGKFEVDLINEYVDTEEGKLKRFKSKKIFDVKKQEKKLYISIETLFISIFIILTVIVIGRRVYQYSQVIEIQKKVINGYTPTATSDKTNFMYDNNSIKI